MKRLAQLAGSGSIQLRDPIATTGSQSAALLLPDPRPAAPARSAPDRVAIEELLESALAGKQLSHATAKSIREIVDSLVELEDPARQNEPRRAGTISPETLALVESGPLPRTLARQVQKVARLELYRLFDDPIRDDALRVALAAELQSKFHLSASDLERYERPTELPLRIKNDRQTRALRALLAEPELAPSSRQALVERAGRVADPSTIPVLERIEGSAAAIEAIRKSAKMTIVFATMEVKPYAFSGGLSNVMSELPKALAKLGHRVIVLAPRHAVIDRGKLEDTKKTGLIFGPDGTEGFGLLKDTQDGVDFYFIENDRYFSKDRFGIYTGRRGDYQDNAERYDFFGAAIPAATKLILGGDAPDIIQLNDAHTASAAAYIKRDGNFADTRTIMAVHNLGEAYQGRFPKHHLPHTRVAGLNLFWPTGPFEFFDELNYLKLGLMESDGVVTVSRKYMHEILTDELGAGLATPLRALKAKGKLWGNLNGIDPGAWNSETDPLIPNHFSIDDLAGKRVNKAALQSRFGLEARPDVPLIGVVARLTGQKGFDDIIATIERAMAEKKDVQFLITGKGEQPIADHLRRLVAENPGRIAFDIDFDVEKEHQVYAGSDFFLMPSKFEPSGLPQMYALRYGTIPIVRAVGGLDESIEAWDPKAKTGTGFKFSGGAGELYGVFEEALGWYAGGEDGRRALLENAMRADFSWENTSAREQLAFYRYIRNRSAIPAPSGNASGETASSESSNP